MVKGVLFVCTGNVFRSFIAEYCLKNYLNKKSIGDVNVSSAGINVKGNASVDPVTIQILKQLGVAVNSHKQRMLTGGILKNQEVVIAMSLEHQRFMKERFNYNAFLFNELAINKKTSVLDIEDCVKNYSTNRKAVERFIEETVVNINKGIPKVYERISTKLV